jgi:integrase
MAARMEKTRHPGIYKRGSRYVVIYRDGNGRQHKESARTLGEAQRLKAARTADVARGEFHEQTRVRFRDYAEEWVERHHGRKGFRESTRDDYRRDLRKYAYPFFDERLGRTVSHVTPRDVANFVAWLCDEREQGRRLSDGSVRRILAPVRSCFATAVREGLVRHNPAAGASLPHRVGEEADGEEVRSLTREQLSAFLDLVHPRYRTLFTLLAETGLRWSEVAALRWQDLRLDGSRPVVKVRRALVRGRYGPPKSKHSRRDVPLNRARVSDLRERRRRSEWGREDDLVFASEVGSPLDHSNLLRRVLRPVAEEVGAPWAGFHTFRHTCASLLFERGANAKQVQRWLGHHSPSFTLDTYVHLLTDDVGEPIELDSQLMGESQHVAREVSI